ncbi:MAG: ExbD/TolR family protein [Ectothiorhodospira sp.]
MLEELPRRRRRRISLTPLIDVVFNLLLFFMLASSLSTWHGIDLATGSERAEADEAPAAEVRLKRDGLLAYDGERHELEPLGERLAQALEQGEISSVILRADPEVRLARLVDTFDQLNARGITALALGEDVSREP